MQQRTVVVTFLLVLSAAAGFAQAPIGSEFRVNAFTTNNQIDSAVAPLANGGFVVVWSGNGPDDYSGVSGQRFTASGARLGAEFTVNTTTGYQQRAPRVASDPSGAFVVVWESHNGTDGDSTGVFARRYDTTGAAVGGQFPVNSYTTNTQYHPVVAADAAGNFVVAWASYSQTGDQYSGIFAQRFNASGAAVGSEFHVNTSTANRQGNPAVAMDQGGFVVAWNSNTLSGYQVFVQRYDDTGDPVGAEQQITFPSGTSGNGYPSIATKAGNFVVVWAKFYYGGSGTGVFGRRYDATGTARGDEFRVNSYTTGSQAHPAVALDTGGNFAVTWLSDQQDGSANGIFGQVYDAAGARAGVEFRANTATFGDQEYPSAAMSDAGRFVVAWTGYASQDGSGGGVFGQRFLADPIFRDGFEP